MTIDAALSRRTLLLGAGALLGSIALASCAPRSGGSASPSGDPVEGGTLRLAWSDDPLNLDPHQRPQLFPRTISRTIADTLTDQDPETGEIRPWIAESWEVSEDVRTFTFTIRDGVTFSDGSPLDAARSLLRGALRAGTRDNVTVIVADVHDPDLEQDAEFVPEPAVVVGASLGQAQLDGSARAVLLDAFPDAATLLDTVPRVPLDEVDEDTLPPRGAAAARSAAAAGDGAASGPRAVPGGGVALVDGPQVPDEPGEPDQQDTAPSPDVTQTVPVATSRDVTETVPVPPPAVATEEPAGHRTPETTVRTDAEGLEALFGPGASTGAPSTVTTSTTTAAASTDDESGADDGDAAPAARPSNRPGARDVLWLGLVVASFTAVTLSVWFTQS